MMLFLYPPHAITSTLLNALLCIMFYCSTRFTILTAELLTHARQGLKLIFGIQTELTRKITISSWSL